MPFDLDEDFVNPLAEVLLKIREEKLTEAGILPGTREYEDTMDKLSGKDTSIIEANDPAIADDHIGGYRTAAVPASAAPWNRGPWYGARLPWLGSACLLLVFWIGLTFAPPSRHTPSMVALLVALSLGCAVFPRVANVYAWCAVDEDGKKFRDKVSDKAIQTFNCVCLMAVWGREALGFGDYGTFGRVAVICLCIPLTIYQILSGLRDIIEEYKRHTAYCVKPAAGFFAR